MVYINKERMAESLDTVTHTHTHTHTHGYSYKIGKKIVLPLLVMEILEIETYQE